MKFRAGDRATAFGEKLRASVRATAFAEKLWRLKGKEKRSRKGIRFSFCRDDWTTFEPVYQRPTRITGAFGDDWGSMSNNWQELANTCRWLAGQLSNLSTEY